MQVIADVCAKDSVWSKVPSRFLKVKSVCSENYSLYKNLLVINLYLKLIEEVEAQLYYFNFVL